MKTQTTKKMMHAVRIYEYGGPDVLKYEEVEVPEPAADEVLVKINYSSVNPFDWKIRAGFTKQWIQLSMPAILGIDVAGVVEKVGSKVNKFKKGDKVYGRADFTKGGSYAEYAAINENSLGMAPRSMTPKEAAGLPVVAGTAWNAIFDIANVQKGTRILITGASGGVGTMAVQLAKSVGAHVIGTTSKANVDMVKRLGADEVIDYTDGDFTKKVKQPVDVVFDTVGHDTLAKSYGIIKKGGLLVTSAGQPDDALAQKHGITAKTFQAKTDSRRYEQIAKLVDEGQLKVIIDSEFPLKEITAAHKLSESSRAKGKIMIKVA